MSSPGSGKTTTLRRTIEALGRRASGVELERLKPKVLAHMIKRKLRIADRTLTAPLRSGSRQGRCTS